IYWPDRVPSEVLPGLFVGWTIIDLVLTHHYLWLSLRRALTTRRRSDSLRASSAIRLAASCGSLVIMSSMASALSTAISQSVSVVQAEKRMPLSSSDISARRNCSPQGCTRSTAIVPVSSTTMKLPYSSWRITSRLDGMAANSKKRSMRSTASLSRCAMYLSLAHSPCSSLPPRLVGRRLAPTSTARASQGTSIESSTPWPAKAVENSTESVWSSAGLPPRVFIFRRLRMPFISGSGMRRLRGPQSRSWVCAAGGSAREVLGDLGLAAGLGRADDVAAHEVGEVLVQRLHAHAVAGLDGGVHLRHLGLANQVADGAGAQHDLVRGHAARAILGFAQCLRDHGLQRFGQHRTHHFLFFGREHVDDPVN